MSLLSFFVLFISVPAEARKNLDQVDDGVNSPAALFIRVVSHDTQTWLPVRVSGCFLIGVSSSAGTSLCRGFIYQHRASGPSLIPVSLPPFAWLSRGMDGADGILGSGASACTCSDHVLFGDRRCSKT